VVLVVLVVLVVFVLFEVFAGGGNNAEKFTDELVT